MKLTIKVLMIFLAVIGLTLASGCGNNDAQPTNTAQCHSDGDCNANNKCMVCQGGSCSTVSDCCTTDLDCGSGQRCWNVKGKAYGKCGAAN